VKLTISNSSTLISLAKINKLELLKKLRKEIKTPEEVYRETVVKGKQKGYVDALAIEGPFTDKWIKSVSVKVKNISKIKGEISKKLEKGDYEVLALADQESAKEILTDDVTLASIALIRKLHPMSSSDVLLEALGKELINLGEFKTSIRLLVIHQRITAEVANMYILRGEKIVSNKREDDKG